MARLEKRRKIINHKGTKGTKDEERKPQGTQRIAKVKN
jgi:hypothetical protein